MSNYGRILTMRGEARAFANHHRQDAEWMDCKTACSDGRLIEILYDIASPYQKRPYKQLANGAIVRDHRQLLLNIAELMEPMECEMHVTESRGKKVIKCSACGKTIKPPAIDAIPKESRDLYHAGFAASAYGWLKYCPICGCEVMDILNEVE